jgi:dipeptidyl aminopeptidase/acylaminoacyl peptidase
MRFLDIGGAEPASSLAVLLFLAVALASGSARSAAAEAPLIPLETIFGNPEKLAPQVSPDGTQLAYLAPDEGVLNVWVRSVGAADDHVITHDRGRGILTWFWSPRGDRILYLQDMNGDENVHLYGVPLAGGDAVDYTPRPNVRAEVVAMEPAFANEILVGLNDRDPEVHDVYRLNLKTGALALEMQNDMGAAGWIADHKLLIRLAVVPRPDGGMALRHRAAPGRPWTELTGWDSEDALTTSPLSFAIDNQTLYMTSSVGANTAELRTLDVVTGSERRMARDPSADVSAVIINPTRFTLEAVAFSRDRLFWRALEADVRLDFEAMQKLSDGDFNVVSQDLNDRTWIVAFTRDTGPVTYYAYDRGTRTGTFLFSARPKLEGLKLASMKPVTFPSADGLTIHGYLSLPADREAKNLPAVLNIHGGPWARDSWGYHPEAQWLANRGYACLQINYRGSTGYGKEFLNGGDREWGGKMQDDISAGAKWLVEQGIADPKRIAIYGGSYGGYAVLSGLTTTPDLYACGVDIVGPSNLVTWITTIPPYWKPMRDMLYKRVGNPDTEAEFLKSRSPLFFVDRIRAPLFIAQGKNDPRVKREESLQIRDALQGAGKTVQFLEFEDEGHGFQKPANRLAFYRAAETFLAKHLGGRSEG